MNDQCRYFTDRALRDKRRIQHFQRWVTTASITGVACALALGILVLLTGLGAFSAGPERDTVVAVLILVTTLALVIAGLLEGYTDKAAFAEQAKQYERMALLFQRASKILSTDIQSERGAEAAALIRELGKEALAENADWVILHRGRPVEVPMPS